MGPPTMYIVYSAVASGTSCPRNVAMNSFVQLARGAGCMGYIGIIYSITGVNGPVYDSNYDVLTQGGVLTP